MNLEFIIVITLYAGIFLSFRIADMVVRRRQKQKLATIQLLRDLRLSTTLEREAKARHQFQEAQQIADERVQFILKNYRISSRN